MKTKLFSLSLLLIIIASVNASFAQKAKHEIKFASVAPKGTTPILYMEKLNKELMQKTNGEVKIRIYAGTQGDELEIISRIKRGRLASGGFTGYGLGEILPMMRVMELPFLFRNYDEVDYVIEKVYDRFAKAFEEKDFVLLGWTEVGFVHVFSNMPIRTVDDLKQVKMWMWKGDPLVKTMFEELSIAPIPLGLTEVRTSLQSGLIDAVYSTPYGAVAMQWNNRTKYVSSLQLTDAAGAIVMRKGGRDGFDSLPEEYQAILLETSKKWLRELVLQTRIDNKGSMETFVKQGLTIVDTPTGADLEAFTRVGETVREKMVGELYSRELLDEVLGHLSDFRNRK